MHTFENYFPEPEIGDNFFFDGKSINEFMNMAEIEDATVYFMSGSKQCKVDKIAGRVVCSGWSTYVFNDESKFYYELVK